MTRIIIEDMKLNKGRRESTFKKEEVSSFRPTEAITKKENRSQEIEYIKEEKINEYFKNKYSSNQRLQRTPEVRKRSKILHKPTIIIFIICILFGAIYWGGDIFQKANITITAKHQLITYNNKQFIASKDQSGNPINFEIMILSDKKTKDIILTDTKEVSVKAEGSITLYNEFGTNVQNLAKGTFLSDDSGKTYKTNNAIAIPGYKIDKDKKIIPGQVVVNISAFLSGEAYNGSPTNFYINSFKGTPKYSKIYGKLKSPLVGGIDGLVYILSDKDKSNIDNVIKSSLKEDLLKQVKAQVPKDYILYPNALIFSYKIEDNFLSKIPEAKIPIEGTLSVVLLKEKSLADNIIKISLPNIGEEESKEITISGLDKLSFGFTNKDQLITKDMDTVSFFLRESVDAIWNPDKDILKTKLLGVHKDKVPSVFKQDPGIVGAIVKIFPPWKKYIPNDISKINIIIN